MALVRFDIPVSKFTPKRKYKFFYKKLKYNPHGGQKKFHDSDARFRVITAGSRTGKTTGAAAEVIAYAWLPNKVIWCVAPTYDLSEKVFRIVWRKMVEEWGCETLSGTSYRDRRIRFAWGTEVCGRSCENPKSLLGEGVDFMVVDEAARISKMIWDEYLRERLMDKIGKAIIISSPKGTAGWFPEFYKRGQNSAFEQWASWRITLYENPHIPREEIEMMALEMPKEVFDQEVLGKFVPYGGLVFKGFDEGVHLSADAEFNPEIPITLAVDFGKRNPTSVLFCHRMGAESFHIFDEYYVAGLDTIDNAFAVQRKLEPYLAASIHKSVHTYHDPSGSDEASIFKKIIKPLVMIPGINDIKPGNITLETHLKEKKHTGRPGILVNPRCENTAWEFTVYHYPKKKKRDDAPVSENPVDVDNHSMAALRYWIHTIAPASYMPLDFNTIRASRSLSICAREAGNDYIREISNLKGIVAVETQTPED